MAFLKCLQKKIIYNDSTMACMIDYYSQFSNLCRKTIHEGNILDKMAFNNCDLLLMASEWAAESVINDYRINPEKVKVVPFGANMENNLTDKEISEIIYSRSARNVCNLLFVGVDWERKGGSIAVEIACLLHKRGIEVHLDIIGIRKELTLPSYIINHGFISKFTETGRKKIENLYKNASFFVLPTRAECAGIVFCEAASYGLPSIATKTGGVSTYIKDNFNGMTFSVNSSSKSYADYIEKIFLDKKKYEQLCFQSFLDYKKRLNWEVVGCQIRNLIKEIL
jgi:glycosyltransferase involved in cell wall biosynthesis